VKFSQILRKIALPLFVVTVIGTSLDQWITMKMESHLMNPNGTSSWVWAYGALSLILSLLYPLTALLLVLSTKAEKSPLAFLKQNFSQSLIENMRAWGSIMLWSLLFILPGIYKFLQYLFVPFIVCFDPAYQRGEKDILQASKAQSKGQLIILFLAFLLFSVSIPILMAAFDEWKLIWKTPVSALLICLVEMLLNLCFIQVIWKVYQRSLGYESSLSMARH
jgi:hypothetical protein